LHSWHFVPQAKTIAKKVATFQQSKDEEKQKQEDCMMVTTNTHQIKVWETIRWIQTQQSLHTNDYCALITQFKEAIYSPLKPGAKAADMNAPWEKSKDHLVDLLFLNNVIKESFLLLLTVEVADMYGQNPVSVQVWSA
jgi:plastocyanin